MVEEKDIINKYFEENASDAYVESDDGDIIIFSKSALGRLIILENFDVDDEDFDGVHIDRLYDLVEQYTVDVISEILTEAIQYCDNHNINYHM